MSCWKFADLNRHQPGFAGSLLSAGLGTLNNDVPVPVVPLPNSDGVLAAPPVDGGGFEVFPKMLPPFPNGEGLVVDGFAPNGLPWVVPGAGPVEVVPPPNRLPPVVEFVVVPGVVEVVPKSEPAGLVPKTFPGAVVVVPVPVVPVPVVPVPGVVFCVVPV